MNGRNSSETQPGAPTIDRRRALGFLAIAATSGFTVKVISSLLKSPETVFEELEGEEAQSEAPIAFEDLPDGASLVNRMILSETPKGCIIPHLMHRIVSLDEYLFEVNDEQYRLCETFNKEGSIRAIDCVRSFRYHKKRDAIAIKGYVPPVKIEGWPQLILGDVELIVKRVDYESMLLELASRQGPHIGASMTGKTNVPLLGTQTRILPFLKLPKRPPTTLALQS